MDPDYVDMMIHIENDTDIDDIPPECELKQLKEFMDRMSIVNFDAGTRLNVKDESEICRLRTRQATRSVHLFL